MTESLSKTNYITVPDWEKLERARHLNYGPKADIILTEAEYDTNPEQTRRQIETFLEEVEHDLEEVPIEGEVDLHDRDDFVERLRFYVDASNDPKLAEQLPHGILSIIPHERGLRDAFKKFSESGLTGQRLLDAATERVKLYDIEQEAHARMAARQKGQAALNSIRL